MNLVNQEYKLSDEQSPPTETKTYLPTYHGCFVCGQTHPSGLCSRFYAGEGGKVHAEFKPNQNQTGYLNIVHGGIISAFLDELMGWPICLETNLICYTGELTIRFRKQVFAGQTYIGTGYPGVKVEGKRYWDGRGELKDDKGNLLAEATGRYFSVPESQTHAFGAQMTYEPGDMPVFRPKPAP